MGALSKMYKGGSKPSKSKSKRVKGGVMTAGVLTGAGVDFKHGKTPVYLSMADLNLD